MSGTSISNGICTGGSYTIQAVAVGCKLYILRRRTDGQMEERLAEVLSIREKSDLLRNGQDANTEGDQYFVHWEHFNKRLDEWVLGSRLILAKDLHLPRPREIQNNEKIELQSQPQSYVSTANTGLCFAPGSSTQIRSMHLSSPPVLVSLKRKRSFQDVGGDEDGEREGELGSEIDDQAHNLSITYQEATPSLPLDLKGYRGSMTQSVSGIKRVKNLNRLQLGKYEVDAWYFSPYPREFAHLPILYICEFCLHFFPSLMMYSRHCQRCHILHPPGNEIYRHSDLSFFEVDGTKQRTWCRNLCLVSKCFLDHKVLDDDVLAFMFYVLVKRDSLGCHIIGYFSKSKYPYEDYNVACILTLPQYQRKGYGKFLIAFSYELSKKENKVGSPEKPLSDLGLLGYRAYWEETIIKLLLSSDGTLSIDEIAQKTSIAQADILNTCGNLELLKIHKNVPYLCLTDSAMKLYEKYNRKHQQNFHPECLNWCLSLFNRKRAGIVL